MAAEAPAHTEKQIGGEKNGGTRLVPTTKASRFYPAEDARLPKKSRKVAKPTKLRSSIVPGSVLILLAGRFSGKRVVFLKQLDSGLLLVTGPYKVNGVPLRRVNQAYVIVTQTRIDLGDFKVDEKVNDAYFAKTKAKGSKSAEEEFFAEGKPREKDALPESKLTIQKEVDAAVIAAVRKTENLAKYLKATFGPEFIVSSSRNTSPTQSQVPVHVSLRSRRSTFSASRTSLSNVEASNVRRTRSANASPGREVELFQGAPPPYTSVYLNAPSSGFKPLEALDMHLAVPDVSHQTNGHRTAVSSVTPGNRGDNRIHSVAESQRSTSLDPEVEIVPEEFGYGIGDGMKADSKHAQVVMIPTAASSSRLTSRSELRLTSNPVPRTQRTEDPLELLSRYKTVFIIDDSSSMAGEKWVEAREALASLADIASKYDMDGIDAYFLNANRSAHNMRNASSVKRQFDSIQPHGISLLGRKIEELLHDYLTILESAKQDVSRGDLRAVQRVTPINYIIITDGVPTDDPEAVIVQAARRLDKGNFPLSQVGIQFVQVGDDPRATEALRELDDGLPKEYGIRDMVDFTPYRGGALDSEMLIKILLGGISRRVDKKGAKSVL
ncbi:hypothetical protein EW145_g474 [Phellinidium pouzarii]|uniref:VWFA domain-containing protein n=1 Tax=Phellinidium pouzarii TaxID=167371 RepID=A0A4S4LIU6_9AGAM|nr:hypothetical protein EW145_g474 [Phellinidium pouzarii]